MPTGTLDVLIHLPNRSPHRAPVALRAAHLQSSVGPVASPFPSVAVHPVLRLQQLRGNRHVQRLIEDQRSLSSPAPQIGRKAPSGGSCPSAPSEEEAAQAQAKQAQE